LLKNNRTLGVILGIVAPLLVVLALYFFRFSYYSLPRFLDTVRQENRLITFFAAWCLVANIALFTLYINTNKYQTARGIFIVTLIYGLLFLLLKLFN